ncbi:MAG TPA: rhomboid family intramembrane serine protease, partial [Gemmatimonadales bacterium]|nr:rhomboid family intramembrane serine protease [Gemmatimonadales bacterium]
MGRLIIANAVVLLLLMTVFTSPALQEALRFAPGEALRRPWTFVTYMFVHAGLLHLLSNMLMLYVFGTAVESRMGSRHFILYYLYCG